MSKEEAVLAAQQELNMLLVRKNSMRVFVSCVILAILLPVYMLVTKLAGIFGDNSAGMIVYLAIIEAVQIILGVISYFLYQADETEKLPWFNRIYYYLTALLILFVARNELAFNGNYLVYVLLAGFISLLPVMRNAERRFYVYPCVIAMWITAASAGAGLMKFFIVALLALAAVPLSLFVQNSGVEQERMIVRLRAKTVTSERDPLTKLTNRRGLDRKASVLWPYCARTATPIGAIEIDIDFFKKYNDHFGHPAGDKCIRRIASAIRNSAKRSSDITARIGGEEFMVFVQGMTESELVDLAMKIRSNIDALKIPHATVNISKYVTVSMGAALITPNADNSFDDLYATVDKALYAAKENGRNCVVCNGHIYGKMRNGLSLRIPS